MESAICEKVLVGESPNHISIKITDEHHVSQARQEAIRLARNIGLKKTKSYYVATAVSELANNIIFHSIQGVIVLSTIHKNTSIGIEVIADDTGPGIPNIEEAMQDGFTTNGGLGGGLPGVRRLMDEFEITSVVDTGTRIKARKWQICK